MSQFYTGISSGNLPPEVATSYTTQSGTAVPAANVLIINAIDSTENNDNGIISKGGVVGTGTANEVDVVLTNRAYGSGTTTSAPSTATLITFPIAENTAYQITVEIIGYGATGAATPPSGVIGAKEVLTVYRDTGGVATLVNSVDSQQNSVNLLPFLAYTTISGNNVVVNGFGSINYNINWVAKLTYIQVS